MHRSMECKGCRLYVGCLTRRNKKRKRRVEFASEAAFSFSEGEEKTGIARRLSNWLWPKWHGMSHVQCALAIHYPFNGRWCTSHWCTSLTSTWRWQRVNVWRVKGVKSHLFPEKRKQQPSGHQIAWFILLFAYTTTITVSQNFLPSINRPWMNYLWLNCCLLFFLSLQQLQRLKVERISHRLQVRPDLEIVEILAPY